jgi:hypothetical protein
MVRTVIALAAAGALGGCVVVETCAPGLVDCGGYCADLSSDETDCGACGAACAVGDYCDRGICIVGSCLTDGTGCTYDSECCSNFCASDGACGCIPSGNAGCAGAGDCCSGRCARDGVCN